MSSKKETPSITEVVSEKAPNKFVNSKMLIIALAVLVTLGGVGSGAYYYLKYQATQKVLGKSTKSGAEETASLIKKVDKLIELPKGENPTIATVSDITKLKGQAFFKNAKNGDKVLIYAKSKKAILYDPKVNKIIEAQYINIGSAEQTFASPSAQITPAAVRIVLLNGTKTAGLATTTEKTLAGSKSITVVSKGNAKEAYTKTLVIDLSADKAGLTGKNTPAAAEIAKVLKGEVGKLPLTEVKPTNADILVILGGK